MEVAHPQSPVLCLPDSWSNWNLEMLVFEERGKLEYLQQRREPTINSTHIWRRHRDLNMGPGSLHLLTVTPINLPLGTTMGIIVYTIIN